MPVQKRDLCQHPRPLRREPDKHPPAVLSPRPTADKVKRLELVDETHSTVMLYLEALTQIGNRQTRGTAKCLQGQESLILLSRQACFRGQRVFTEGEKFSHCVAESR